MIGFVPEFWGGFGEDFNKDGKVTDKERLQWNDEKLKGEGFVNWTKFNHPQLGEVEIGGWKTKFTRQNPPVDMLKGEIEKYVPWMLWLAEISPRVVIKRAEVSQVERGKVVKLSVTIENQGYLPTYITQRALEMEIANPVRVQVELKDAEWVSGKPRVDLGHLNGSRDNEGVTAKSSEYVFKITGKNPVATVTIQSEKGGTTSRQVVLK